MNLDKLIEILQNTKNQIGGDKRIVFYLDDGTTLGRYFIPSPNNDEEKYIGQDANGYLSVIEIKEES